MLGDDPAQNVDGPVSQGVGDDHVGIAINGIAKMFGPGTPFGVDTVDEKIFTHEANVRKNLGGNDHARGVGKADLVQARRGRFELKTKRTGIYDHGAQLGTIDLKKIGTNSGYLATHFQFFKACYHIGYIIRGVNRVLVREKNIISACMESIVDPEILARTNTDILQ